MSFENPFSEQLDRYFARLDLPDDIPPGHALKMSIPHEMLDGADSVTIDLAIAGVSWFADHRARPLRVSPGGMRWPPGYNHKSDLVPLGQSVPCCVAARPPQQGGRAVSMTLRSPSNNQHPCSAVLPPHDGHVEIRVAASGHGSVGELRLASVPGAGAYAYVDVIYVAHSEHGGEIVYQCDEFSLTGRVLPGGRRSHSLAIPRTALGRTRTIRFTSTSALGVESAVARRDFYDFMGLRSSSEGEQEMLANEQRARELANRIDLSIQWFITWKCNLTCAYCWQEVAADRYRHGRINRIEPQAWVDSLERLHPRRCT